MRSDHLSPCTVEIQDGYNFNDEQPHSQTINSKGADLATRIKDAEIDLQQEMSPPPICLGRESIDGRIATIGTLGNISLMIGKAKSKKSFLVGTLVAAMLNGRLEEYGLTAELPKHKSKVLIFDTEQGTFHVHRAGRRVLQQAAEANSENLQVYSLRKYPPAERLEIIEAIIQRTPDVGFVVIDGIRDLTYSINDEECATMLSSKLLKWTEERNIHIMCVLHQNKGDNNARGHLGSELVNKAESVLSVTRDAKNPNISIVEPVFCRDREFEPWAFEINSAGMPQYIQDWSPAKGSSKAKVLNEPINYPPELHAQVLEKVFEKKQDWKYSELWEEIKLVLDGYGHHFGDNKVKKFLKYYKEKGLIVQKGEANSKSSIYNQG
jgi:hypothetical protein